MAPLEALLQAVARKLHLRAADLGELRIVRRALDARHGRVERSFSVDVQLPADAAPVRRAAASGKLRPTPQATVRTLVLPQRPDGPPPVVVGAGPAGLFAALILADAGLRPVLLERGRPVERRSRDVSALYARGTLDLDSNVCFGEGGAGTYSDGKLYTRVGDDRVDAVMQRLVALGADPDILVHNRPHLGTDKLVGLMQAVRAHLVAAGAQLRFETAFSELDLDGGDVRGVRLRGGERVEARHVVLATGHSAREVWQVLVGHGLALEPRPFAVGFRVEHPQQLINEARYGRVLAEAQILPAADYRLTFQDRDGGNPRAAFSFCMCPGGVVVTTPTEPGALCINGMSHASRKGRFANSAIVAQVNAADFAKAGHVGTFAGVAFQDAVERAAYAMGGGDFVAPASRVDDFLAGRISTDLPGTSYRRGLVPGDLSALYPEAITATLKRALQRFGRTIPGFAGHEATLIGVETRTAAPVRLPRGEDGCAVGARGLYPAGEGLGYGGGIVSAAVDGVRAAQSVLLALGATWREVPVAP